MIGRLLKKSGGLRITLIGATVIVQAFIYDAEIGLHLGMACFVTILQEPCIRCARDPYGILGAAAHRQSINVTEPYASRLSMPSDRFELFHSLLIIGKRIGIGLIRIQDIGHYRASFRFPLQLPCRFGDG